MKTAEQRAEEFLMRMAIGNWPWEEMIVHVAVLLKEQDEIARKACADGINSIIDELDGGMVNAKDALKICINEIAV